jgi:hypothetical protein
MRGGVVRQSEITPGVYQSRDGMIRTVTRVEDGRVHYYYGVGGFAGVEMRETSLRNHAAWAARRYDRETLAPTPAVREAEASAALDGETQVHAANLVRAEPMYWDVTCPVDGCRAHESVLGLDRQDQVMWALGKGGWGWVDYRGSALWVCPAHARSCQHCGARPGEACRGRISIHARRAR